MDSFVNGTFYPMVEVLFGKRDLGVLHIDVWWVSSLGIPQLLLIRRLTGT